MDLVHYKKLVQIKNISFKVQHFDSAILFVFSNAQAKTSGGKAFHAIIGQGRNENLYVLACGRMGAYL